MITRLPIWVWFGGCVLAFIAGIVNAIGFLGISHQAISHLTGTTTLSALALTRGQFHNLLYLAALFLSFLGGAVASGFLIRHSTLQIGRQYGLVLGLESGLLIIATFLLSRGFVAGEYLAAGACGLQNAMATSYSGAVVRTTHISGMVTDVGIIIGHWLRGSHYDAKRLHLNVMLVSSFFMGGVGGAIAFPLIGYLALLIPAALTGLAALGYTLFTVGNSSSKGCP